MKVFYSPGFVRLAQQQPAGGQQAVQTAPVRPTDPQDPFVQNALRKPLPFVSQAKSIAHEISELADKDQIQNAQGKIKQFEQVIQPVASSFQNELAAIRNAFQNNNTAEVVSIIFGIADTLAEMRV